MYGQFETTTTITTMRPGRRRRTTTTTIPTSKYVPNKMKMRVTKKVKKTKGTKNNIIKINEFKEKEKEETMRIK